MKRGMNLTTSLLAALVLLVAINIVAMIVFANMQADLTEEKLYTLSEGSRQIVGEMEDEVTVKLFYSQSEMSGVPRLKQYAERVIGLMEQYKAASGGKLIFEQLEPKPDTEIEEFAIKYGIQPISLVGADKLYLGLAMINEVGREETVPFLDPGREAFLEYDLTRMLQSLSTTTRERIGVMSPLDVLGTPNDPMMQMNGQRPVEPWVFVSELKKQYEVVKIEADAESIDSDLSMLMVIHPKELSEKTQFAIDQYILAGGKALIYTDPLCYYELTQLQQTLAGNPQAMFQASVESNLPKLFESWGVEMVAGRAVCDPTLATRLNMGRVIEHPTVLTLGAEECNQDEIISANLETLMMAHAGELKIDEEKLPEGLTATTLIHASDKAGTTDAMMLKFGGDPDRIKQQMEQVDQVPVMAVKLSGKFHTAFPNGEPLGEGEEETGVAAQTLIDSVKDSTVVIVSDVDLLADDISVRKQQFFGQVLLSMLNDNIAFTSNAAENLMGSQALISLRTRGKSDRPFTRVVEIEQQANERYKERLESLIQEEQETSRRLNELERGKDDENRALLSQSQLEEVRKYRERQAEVKRELREVRRSLREDVEALGFRYKFISIALMPLLVLLAGFVPVTMRHLRAK